MIFNFLKKLTKTIMLLSVFSLSNCATQNSFLSDQKDGWFSDHDKGLFYCRANVKDKETADPTCFEAGFHRYEKSTNLTK